MAGSRLEFDLFARDHGASTTFKRFGSAVDSSHRSTGIFSAGLGKLAGAFAGLAVISKATSFIKDSVAEQRDAVKVGNLTNAVLKSTGGVSNETATGVANLANQLSLKAGVDDELVQSGENVLLTFRNIRNEVGAGNDIFTQATGVTLDMSQALGKDLRSSSIMVGKALNDPVLGVTALGRAGVQFTAKQKTFIKSLVDSGHTMHAQKIILGELKAEFGGAAAAMADPADKAKVAWENFQEEIGARVVPVLNDLETWFAKDGIPILEKGLHWVETDGVAALHSFGDEVIPLARDLLPQLADSALGFYGVARRLVPVALDLVHGFEGLPDEVQKFIIVAGTGAVAMSKLNTAIAGFKVTGFVGAVMNAETRTKALGQAAKAAAGAAGIALLYDATSKAPSEMGIFEEAVGGALAGSMFGPIGTTIGGVAGAVHGMYRADKAFTDQLNSEAIGAVADYTSTLSGMNAAITGSTRALVAHTLAQDGVLASASKLGISTSDLVSATLGNQNAQDRVTGSLDQQRAKYMALAQAMENKHGTASVERAQALAMVDAIDKLSATYEKNRSTLRGNIAQQRLEIEAVRGGTVSVKAYHGVMSQLPPKVQTAFKQIDIDSSMRDVIGLSNQYKLTPKQVTTVMKALGFDMANRTIQGTIGHLHAVSEVKPDLNPFTQLLLGGLRSTRSQAGAEASGIGIAMSSGISGGIMSGVGSIIYSATAAVEAGLAAARKAADAHSPSRKMAALGTDLVDGLIVGMKHREHRLQQQLTYTEHLVEQSAGRLSSLMSARSSFESGFRSSFATSVFGNEFATDPRRILVAQRSARNDARKLNRETHKLVHMGLSNDLIQQLAASGPAGLAQIEALAHSSRKTIRQYNRLNAQTRHALGSAAQVAGNDIYAGRIKDARSVAAKRRDQRDDIRRAIHGVTIRMSGATDRKAKILARESGGHR